MTTFPEAAVRRLHASTLQRGRLFVLFGVGLLGLSTAAAVGLWEPLGVLGMPGLIVLIIGGVMWRYGGRGVQRNGDLEVRIEGGRVHVEHGDEVLVQDAAALSVLVRSTHLELMTDAAPPAHAVSIPLFGDEATRWLQTEAEGIPSRKPNAAPLQVAGGVLAVILVVVAVMVVLRLAAVGVLIGLVEGIKALAPDDPLTQVTLFLAFAGFCGLALLVRTVVRWRALGR